MLLLFIVFISKALRILSVHHQVCYTINNNAEMSYTYKCNKRVWSHWCGGGKCVRSHVFLLVFIAWIKILSKDLRLLFIRFFSCFFMTIASLGCKIWEICLIFGWNSDFLVQLYGLWQLNGQKGLICFSTGFLRNKGVLWIMFLCFFLFIRCKLFSNFGSWFWKCHCNLQGCLCLLCCLAGFWFCCC